MEKFAQVHTPLRAVAVAQTAAALAAVAAKSTQLHKNAAANGKKLNESTKRQSSPQIADPV